MKTDEQISHIDLVFHIVAFEKAYFDFSSNFPKSGKTYSEDHRHNVDATN